MSDGVGFLSYARADDSRDEGETEGQIESSWLSRFREALSAEVERLTGFPFVIFQDRVDIRWGSDWRAQIRTSLERSTFLIPIITPGYFESPLCRGELEQFLIRERALGRTDLILPIYYETYDPLYDPLRQATDPLLRTIASRQVDDWRELRHESISTPAIQRRIAKLAQEIVTLLPSATATVASSRALGHVRRDRGGSSRSSRVDIRSESSVVIVGEGARAHFRSLAAAVREVPAGLRILVLPGVYREGVVIDKPLEIIGEGNDPSAVSLRVSGSDAVVFATTMGRVANISIHQLAGQGDYVAVDIAQGRLDLEDCDIRSESLSAVLVRGGSDPRLRRNTIHGSKVHGIVIMEDSFGTFEDNHVHDNTMAGVVIREGSDPVLRRNRIAHNKHHGVYVLEASAGTLEDNDIHDNGFPGVAIIQGSETILRRNHIHDGRQHGVYVSEQASGTIADNDIHHNKYPGLVILQQSDPTVTGNRIHHNRDHGVWVDEDGLGRLEGNRVTENRYSGVYILEGGNPRLVGNVISANREYGLHILDRGRGHVHDNTITANRDGGIFVSADSSPELSANHVTDNGSFQIEIEEAEGEPPG
ncbi:right-handed parallel beta-helix repeat-containing protein [Nonomuraea sp. NPDC050310]|uniref:right-handed parallel beta-helix repeat-containing protein n=1 Tax=Nonomuraea sp. NPDC050310 TaxID=3154935 RepID=UPI0033CAED5D